MQDNLGTVLPPVATANGEGVSNTVLLDSDRDKTMLLVGKHILDSAKPGKQKTAINQTSKGMRLLATLVYNIEGITTGEEIFDSGNLVEIGLHQMCEGPFNTVNPGLGSPIRYSVTILKADYIIRKDKSKSADVME